MFDIYSRQAPSASSGPDPDDRPPTDFDAAASPIVVRHGYGIGPLRPVGEIADRVVADLANRMAEHEQGRMTIPVDLRFRRRVELLHALGPRPIYELLPEIGDRYGWAWFEERLRVNAELDPKTVRALGADQFARLPIREVA